MTNNDVLRRIRYIFDLSDRKMISIFGLGGYETNRTEISDWLKKEDDPALVPCYDEQLANFLNGLIIEKRGKREGPEPIAEKRLSNNLVLKKLKIALDLKAEDILAILDLADLYISKYELSAFFRKPDHKHYRKCRDQVLRNFLKGLQLKLRPGQEGLGSSQPVVDT